MLESIVDTELTENKCYDDQEDVYSSNTTGYTNIYKRRPISRNLMLTNLRSPTAWLKKSYKII